MVLGTIYIQQESWPERSCCCPRVIWNVYMTGKLKSVPSLLVTKFHSPFQAKFCRPFTVLRWVIDQNYMLLTPNRRKTTQLCQVNLLKPYYCRKPTSVSVVAASDSPFSGGQDDGVTAPDDGLLRGRLFNCATLWNLPSLLAHLSEGQSGELITLIHHFPSLFGDTPSRTHLITHDSDVGTTKEIHQHFYRVLEE